MPPSSIRERVRLLRDARIRELNAARQAEYATRAPVEPTWRATWQHDLNEGVDVDPYERVFGLPAFNSLVQAQVADTEPVFRPPVVNSVDNETRIPPYPVTDILPLQVALDEFGRRAEDLPLSGGSLANFRFGFRNPSVAEDVGERRRLEAAALEAGAIEHPSELAPPINYAADGSVWTTVSQYRHTYQDQYHIVAHPRDSSGAVLCMCGHARGIHVSAVCLGDDCHCHEFYPRGNEAPKLTIEGAQAAHQAVERELDSAFNQLLDGLK